MNQPEKCFYHTSVVFNDKLWLFGEIAGGGFMFNDVWRSSP